MEFKKGTTQDLDSVCFLIKDAIAEMEKNGIYQCDEQYNNAEWEYESDSAYVLHRFCVSPKVQNRGIGKKVLLHIEQQIKNMGYNSVRLDTFTQNPFAQKLYRHNGYESRGYADWRKGRFDLMEKKL